MTRNEAIKKLKETREITTDMLEPLDIRFETFLMYSQLEQSDREDMVNLLIDYMEAAA